jgi:hypothetical protein
MALSTDAEVSVRFNARLAGLFYLLNILTGASALFAHGRLASALLLISTACYLAVTRLFYHLFRPVNRTMSGLAALSSIIGCVITTLDTLHLAAAPVSPLVFFGIYCLLIGYLILRSTFLPRFLGVLMALGGLGWLTFVSPSFAIKLSPGNMVPGILGEGTLTLWLLLAAVNARQWLEQPTIGGAV